MKALKLPEHLRERLRESIGALVEGTNYRSVALSALSMLKSCGLVIAVGDVVCSSLIDVGGSPNICIVDRKSRREATQISVSNELFDIVLQAKNPPGYITEEARWKVRESINKVLKSDLKLKVLIIVDGEEDLLALPALLNVRDGDCITYGIPGKGVTVIRVDSRVRKLVKEVVNMFEESDI